MANIRYTGNGIAANSKKAPIKEGRPFRLMLARLAMPSNKGNRPVNVGFLMPDYFGVEEIHDGDLLNWRFVVNSDGDGAEAIPLLTCPHG